MKKTTKLVTAVLGVFLVAALFIGAGAAAEAAVETSPLTVTAAHGEDNYVLYFTASQCVNKSVIESLEDPDTGAVVDVIAKTPSVGLYVTLTLDDVKPGDVFYLSGDGKIFKIHEDLKDKAGSSKTSAGYNYNITTDVLNGFVPITAFDAGGNDITYLLDAEDMSDLFKVVGDNKLQLTIPELSIFAPGETELDSVVLQFTIYQEPGTSGTGSLSLTDPAKNVTVKNTVRVFPDEVFYTVSKSKELPLYDDNSITVKPGEKFYITVWNPTVDLHGAGSDKVVSLYDTDYYYVYDRETPGIAVKYDSATTQDYSEFTVPKTAVGFDEDGRWYNHPGHFTVEVRADDDVTGEKIPIQIRTASGLPEQVRAGNGEPVYINVVSDSAAQPQPTQSAASPVPFLGILAGLGAAAFLILRRE